MPFVASLSGGRVHQHSVGSPEAESHLPSLHFCSVLGSFSTLIQIPFHPCGILYGQGKAPSLGKNYTCVTNHAYVPQLLVV